MSAIINADRERMRQMVRFLGEGTGRVLVINLKRVIYCSKALKVVLSEAGIKNAIITSAIGSLQKAVFHRVTGWKGSLWMSSSLLKSRWSCIAARRRS
jgi:hypothetical protein